MKIAIIDADIVGKKSHRFPNLACMKQSAYYKSLGYNVELKIDYNNLEEYDKIIVSKVFTDTEIPGEPEDKTTKNAKHIWDWYKDNQFLKNPKVEFGGTGFYYDKAPKLPDEIEHIMPDYHLYDEWVAEKIAEGGKRKDFVYYLDYSIGFVTRGCFRGCEFCVNQNCKICKKHSPIAEFYDPTRPKLCFLDDNFFACPDWREIIAEIKKINKPFQFKQGLDERLLTDEKINELITWKYDGDFIFAFDNIADREIIEGKLNKLYQLYPGFKKHLKFYVFCGFDRKDVWDDEFYKQDIHDLFERIKILSKYSAVPYVMRYETCYQSDYAGVYSTIAAWCNQPSIFKKFTYREYCQSKAMGNKYSKYKRDYQKYLADGNKKGVAWRYMEELENKFQDIANEYFDFRPEQIAEFGPDVYRINIVK